jgi:hypothetical protein
MGPLASGGLWKRGDPAIHVPRCKILKAIEEIRAMV